MKTVVCSVKDTAAQTYGRPFFVPHGNAAVRSFSDEVNRPATVEQQNDLFSHPDDFELYELGFFDDSTGSLIPHEEGPRLLVRAKDLHSRETAGPTKVQNIREPLTTTGH